VFPGVSGAPGTADVTDSLFSSHRGDGIDNPRRIPDLSGPKSTLKVDQDPKTAALETFIHGLITQEFDGDEPPRAVVVGLADYVRHLSPNACPAAATRPVTPGYYLDDARRALRAAQGEIARGDIPTAILMIGAARSRLGLIDERYADPSLAPLRTELRAFDLRLDADQAALRAKRPGATADLGGWIAGSLGLQRRLEAKAGDSLFDPARLTAAARRRLRG
jgi:hypothetical protein